MQVASPLWLVKPSPYKLYLIAYNFRYIVHMASCIVIVLYLYSILWPAFMWYTGMCSPNGDQLGQWRSLSVTSQWPLIMTSQWVMTLIGMPIVKSQWIMMLLGTSTMSNGIAMCTYHGITMHNVDLGGDITAATANQKWVWSTYHALLKSKHNIPQHNIPQSYNLLQMPLTVTGSQDTYNKCPLQLQVAKILITNAHNC